MLPSWKRITIDCDNETLPNIELIDEGFISFFEAMQATERFVDRLCLHNFENMIIVIEQKHDVLVYMLQDKQSKLFVQRIIKSAFTDIEEYEYEKTSYPQYAHHFDNYDDAYEALAALADSRLKIVKSTELDK